MTNRGDYKHIWPLSFSDLGIPVWGDKVVIGHQTCTVNASAQPTHFLLASLPKAPVSGTSMRTVLKAASRIRLALTEKCIAGPLCPDKADEIAVEVKTALEHYRSILDYLAQDIYRLCKLPASPGKPRKLYFPNAGPNESNADFHRRFQREYPQLRAAAPKLFQHILGIQRFSDETWLRDLTSLVNPMKHQQLAEWEDIECTSLIVHYDGVGVRLGELGLRSISISKGGALRFASPTGMERVLRGPQEIDVNTSALADGDPEIQLDRLKWKTTAIKGTGRSVAGLLAEIDGGVRQVCLEVTRALPSP